MKRIPLSKIFRKPFILQIPNYISLQPHSLSRLNFLNTMCEWGATKTGLNKPVFVTPSLICGFHSHPHFLFHSRINGSIRPQALHILSPPVRHSPASLHPAPLTNYLYRIQTIFLTRDRISPHPYLPLRLRRRKFHPPTGLYTWWLS